MQPFIATFECVRGCDCRGERETRRARSEKSANSAKARFKILDSHSAGQTKRHNKARASTRSTQTAQQLDTRFRFPLLDHACAAMAAPNSANPSRSGSPSQLSSPLFSVEPVNGGAYLGAIASSFIPSGSLVLSETPLFTLDAPLQSFLYQRTLMGGPGSGPTPVEGEEDEAEVREQWEKDHGRSFDIEDWMEKTIAILLLTRTREQRERFWELAASRDDMKETRAWNIFTTNAVS